MVINARGLSVVVVLLTAVTTLASAYAVAHPERLAARPAAAKATTAEPNQAEPMLRVTPRLAPVLGTGDCPADATPTADPACPPPVPAPRGPAPREIHVDRSLTAPVGHVHAG